MSFGNLFSKTIKDFRDNWKEISKFLLIFRGIPLLLFGIGSIIFYVNEPAIINHSFGEAPELTGTYLGFSVFSAITAIIMLLLYFFASGAVTSLSLKKKKFNCKELTQEGKNVFWNYSGFSIVLIIFVFLLLLCLIIPGIIFAVFWMLGVYIFLDKKVGIRQALKESHRMIKGKWWKTFGYFLLLMLIYIAISIAFSLISLPTQIIQIYYSLKDIPTPLILSVISTILGTVSSFLTELIGLPLMILFFKNYYLEFKTKKK